jgi:hypothetical protein
MGVIWAPYQWIPLILIGGLGTIPKGRSIPHNIFNNQNAVFFSMIRIVQTT